MPSALQSTVETAVLRTALGLPERVQRALLRRPVVIDGQTLAGGETTRTFRSKRFRANFGNGGARVTVDGRRFTVPDTGRPIGYEFRPDKRPKRLKESVRVGLCAT